MVKHNNMVPNGHFHNWWQRYVKTWFEQPARHQRRRAARKEKAKTLAPRPIEDLRPIVQMPTLRYCMKTREGRGFSLQELQKVKLTPVFARSVGIAVDHRRRNKSTEGLQRNVQRLEEFKAKIKLLPRKTNKPHKGQINDHTEAQ